jgi:hypothetical protein
MMEIEDQQKTLLEVICHLKEAQDVLNKILRRRTSCDFDKSYLTKFEDNMAREVPYIFNRLSCDVVPNPLKDAANRHIYVEQFCNLNRFDDVLCGSISALSRAFEESKEG